jgi:ankyrin repeat protein
MVRDHLDVLPLNALLRTSRGFASICSRRLYLLAHTHQVGGESALLRSVKKRKEAAFKSLLEKGADGNSVIHFLASDGDTDYMRLLLQHAVSLQVSATDHQGKTPLDLAVDNGHGRMVQLLVEAGARMTQQLNQFLALAAWIGQKDEEIVRLLCRIISPEERNQYLTGAAFQGHISLVRLFLDLGAHNEGSCGLDILIQTVDILIEEKREKPHVHELFQRLEAVAQLLRREKTRSTAGS